MEIFIDSANIEEIAPLTQYGIIDGITTNPSLISKNAKECETLEDFIKSICALTSGYVSVEIISEDFDSMIKEGCSILDIASNIILKLPATWNGVKACNYFAEKNIKTNMTLCFSVSQALICAKAGASYISPFIGRLDDIGIDGITLIQDIKIAFDNYPNIKTKVLAASIRNLYHVEQVAKIGVDAITISPKIFSKLLDHFLTNQGLDIFKKDWELLGQNISVSDFAIRR